MKARELVLEIRLELTPADISAAFASLVADAGKQLADRQLAFEHIRTAAAATIGLRPMHVGHFRVGRFDLLERHR